MLRSSLLLCVVALTSIASACDDKASTAPTAAAASTTPTAAAPSSAPSTPPPAEQKTVEIKTPGLQVLSPAAAPPDAATGALKSMVATYVELKEAFVASDAGQIRTAAATLAEGVKAVSTDGWKPEAADAWKDHSGVMASALATMTNPASDLDAQRAALNPLTDAAYAAVRSFGLTGVVVQYCPMANKGSGGYWLSADKTIRNPYYGDAMLACGEVREVL